MTIYERLKLLRFKSNLTQEYVAEVLNVDYTTYGKYESGKSQLKLEQAVKLGELFGVTLNELYYGTDVYLIKDKKSPEYSKKSLRVEVELTGETDVLEKWIDKLTQINKLI